MNNKNKTTVFLVYWFLFSEAGNIFCRLLGNSLCLESGANSESYCKDSQTSVSYSTPTNSCTALLCSSNQVSSPNCKCSHPYTGILFSRALSISNLGNTSYYSEIEKDLMTTFRSQNLPVDSVSLSNPFRNSTTDYFQLNLSVFPSQTDRFNRTGVSSVSFVLTNQIFQAPDFFSPYFFLGDNYAYYAGNSIF